MWGAWRKGMVTGQDQEEQGLGLTARGSAHFPAEPREGHARGGGARRRCVTKGHKRGAQGGTRH